MNIEKIVMLLNDDYAHELLGSATIEGCGYDLTDIKSAKKNWKKELKNSKSWWTESADDNEDDDDILQMDSVSGTLWNALDKIVKSNDALFLQWTIDAYNAYDDDDWNEIGDLLDKMQARLVEQYGPDFEPLNFKAIKGE